MKYVDNVDDNELYTAFSAIIYQFLRVVFRFNIVRILCSVSLGVHCFT